MSSFREKKKKKAVDCNMARKKGLVGRDLIFFRKCADKLSLCFPSIHFVIKQKEAKNVETFYFFCLTHFIVLCKY